ncbi:MAG: apolipoprotein N-acyltransferase [Rikenellaceae bacterium]
MWRKVIAVVISVMLLSTGWLGLSGLPTLLGLVPLLWISDKADDSRKGWWSTFRYALLTFVLWNVVTVWWIWNATPVGPIAATVVSSTLSMIAFMTFHTLSKRTSKALSYTLLVSLWISLEYWYTVNNVDISWPWLLLGNGFSNDIWAIQWYEFTGLFGGSLWVLLSNILVYEAWQTRSRVRSVAAVAMILVPLAISLVIYSTYDESCDGQVEVTVVQPNIHFGRADRPSDSEQAQNLLALIDEVSPESDFVLMPEGAMPGYVYVSNIDRSDFVRQLREALQERCGDAALISGVSSVKFYQSGEQTFSARQNGDQFYDIFNSAIYIPTEGAPKLHHKAKLVIGTESIPFVWFFKSFDSFIIDLGGSLGQLGRGTERVVFDDPAAKVGVAICYEALYGDYFGEFVRGGAEAMFVVSNDCWWDNTPGYRHLFSMCALRAVEHRRAIARSANTGISGFISSRGDKLEMMGWDERGVLSASVPICSTITFYTKFGDYIARIAVFMTILSLLNYMVYRVRRRNHIV